MSVMSDKEVLPGKMDLQTTFTRGFCCAKVFKILLYKAKGHRASEAFLAYRCIIYINKNMLFAYNEMLSCL